MKDAKVKVKKPGRKSVNQKNYKQIAAIKKGDSLVVKRKDWNIKTVPGQHMLRRNIGREFKVETLIDDSGWLITALN